MHTQSRTATITDTQDVSGANTARKSSKYAAAVLGTCVGLAAAVHAQSVPSPVTAGAAIPESTLVPAIPTTTRTETLNFGATLGFGETDNVFATQSDKHSQTMALLGIDFGWIRTGSALNANVVGDFSYLDYVQGAYAAQLLGRFDGLTSLSLLQDHLKWYLQDDFGEGQLNPFLASTPTNLEHVNVLLTGPELILRPGSDNMFQMGARYGVSTYQFSPMDGTRASENAQFVHLLSPNSNVALGADAEQLRFDNTAVNPDYDRARAYLRYEITGARTQISAAAGETQTNDGGTWIHTPLVQLMLTHEITQQTSFTANAGREFTDAADAFSDVRSGAAGGVAVAAVAQTTEDYLRNYVSAGLQLTGRRTTIGATAYWERDTYAIDNAFDVTRASLELRAGRQLSSDLSADIFGAVTQSRYFNAGGDIDTRTIGADVIWQASRTLSVAGRYSHNTQSNTGGYGFDSNILFITVTYRPIPPASPALQQE